MGKIKFEVPSEEILLQLDQVTTVSLSDADELTVELDRLPTCLAENFHRKADLVYPGNPDPDDLDYVTEEAAFEYVYFDSRRGTDGDILLFKFVIPDNRHLAYFAVQGEEAKILAFCHDNDSEDVGTSLRHSLDQQDTLS